MTSTIEAPQVKDPSLFFGWVITVLNDDHNTFEHVSQTLARVLPNVTIEEGWNYATTIHMQGAAQVFSGMKEPAEHYWAQLDEAGLTLAPLEQG